MGNESTSSAWDPDWAVPPGEILEEALGERSMTQSELARRMDRPLKTINEIIKGKAAITPATAIQLELVLGIHASVWNNLEKTYREKLAWMDAAEQMESATDWAHRFPVKDLVKNGVLDSSPSTGRELVESLLQFFGVSSPSAWEKMWGSPSALYRASPTFSSDPEAVAAWLRWGEIEAEKREVEDFDGDSLSSLLPELRRLSLLRPFGAALRRLSQALATVGVALVILPEFPGTRLSGAARWLRSNKAIVQLSLRHETDDHFWFSLYHEIGHLLAPGRRSDSIDYADMAGDALGVEESRADAFARSALIDPNMYAAFIEAGSFDARAIQDFAAHQEIAPGIVVGRLQADRHIDWNQKADLKFRIGWS